MSCDNIRNENIVPSTERCNSKVHLQETAAPAEEECNRVTCGPCATALGCNTKAFGDCSLAEGTSTKAYGSNSHAEGNNTTAIGDNSHAEGCTTVTNGNCSHAEGSFTTTYADSSHTEGYSTKTRGIRAHAEGISTEANAEGSHAQGIGSKTEGYGSFADGYYSTARGSYSHTEGYTSTTNNSFAHTEGYNTQADGYASHAEGYYTLVKGSYAHVEGANTTANGSYSHAEGYSTSANATFSHTEGNTTIANGYASHAEGARTTANGDYSHAEGVNTIASGYYSHAEGNGTNTRGYEGSHIMGIYGDADTPYSWFLGGGTSDTNRALAAKILYTGNAFIKNAWNAGGTNYAEVFESGCQVIDPGYFVTLNEDKIRLANSCEDYVLGVTTASAGFVANSMELTGTKSPVSINIMPSAASEEMKLPAVIDNEGKILDSEKVVKIQSPPDISTTSAASPVKYQAADSDSYWSVVALLGQVVVFDDGTCKPNGYCMPTEGGIATESKIGYRVLKRLCENQIVILFR